MILWQKNSYNMYHAFDKPLSKDFYIRSLCGRDVSKPGAYSNKPYERSKTCLMCLKAESKLVRTSGGTSGDW